MKTAQTVSLIVLLALFAGCSGDVPLAPLSLQYDAGWEPALTDRPPNRARWAEVSASSSRFGTMPLHGDSILDLIPLTWPRLLPRFVQDESIMTRWASRPDECPHLRFDLLRESEPAASLERLVLEWAGEVPEEFRIEISSDRQEWRSVFQGPPGDGPVQSIAPAPTAGFRSVCLQVLDCPVEDGISLLEVSIHPTADRVLPTAVGRIDLAAAGPRSVHLSWDPVPGAFLYEVHRLSSPREPRGAYSVVGVTRLPFYEDTGFNPGTPYVYRVVPESFSGNRGGAATHLSVRTGHPSTASPFLYRGVVEGFYNQPWSHLDRLEMVRFLGANDLNFYLYAPKVDAYHRSHWREAYPARELRLFRELVDSAEKHGVTFCYGLSPGMDFRWDDPGEPVRILDKFRVFYDMGVRSFCLLFDDTPDTAQSDRHLGETHARLSEFLLRTLREWGDDPVSLLFVPTVYFKTVSALREENPEFVAYLEGLAGMTEEIPVFWVGPGMPYSPVIPLEDARDLASLLGRKVVLWDNYPTTDNFLIFEPFLGPYPARDQALDAAIQGILSNPMNYPNLSKVPLFTLARYLQAPADYDPERAFGEAVQAVGGPAGGDVLRRFALQFYGHPIYPPTDIESPEIQSILSSFWREYETGAFPGSHASALLLQFQALVRMPEQICRDILSSPLRSEMEEPARKLALYGEAGEIALRILGLLNHGELSSLPVLREELQQKIEDAGRLPWRAGENHLNPLAAWIFDRPPVSVDVIGGFLRRVRSMADARDAAGPDQSSSRPWDVITSCP